ncbi:hypothetical protein SAMN05444745_102156 [Arthrobacter sp. OV608]|nr:hypothetical protein SAMN05444745_102156 [Arthrobacter sp. OV608]
MVSVPGWNGFAVRTKNDIKKLERTLRLLLRRDLRIGSVPLAPD